jgi:peroxiredoxin
MKIKIAILFFLFLNVKLFAQINNYYISLHKDLKKGDVATDFTLTNLKGEKITLSKYRGKYVLLEFWGSGCGPCRQENPNLLINYKKYKSKGFEIIGVSLDKYKDNWKRAVDKDSMIWITISDLEGYSSKVILTYNVKGVPMNFLLDPKGVIIDNNIRGAALGQRLHYIFKY